MRRTWGKIFGIALVVSALAILGSSLALAQPTPPLGGWGGYGPGGMMGGWGGYGPGGMMGGWGGYGQYGPNGAWGNRYGTATTPGNLTIDQAVSAANSYLSAVGGSNLRPAEVMEFSNNFYVAVKEKDSGNFAMELLIDRYTGRAYPEMGPNMMWNISYSPMASMMGWGWYGGSNNAPAAVSAEQAQQIANQWLSRYYPGTTVESADAYPGYYTLDTQQNDQKTGMLSVNAYTGQVWLHTWHGDFIQEKELG